MFGYHSMEKITKVPYILYSSSLINVMQINISVCGQAF